VIDEQIIIAINKRLEGMPGRMNRRLFHGAQHRGWHVGLTRQVKVGASTPIHAVPPELAGQTFRAIIAPLDS
jgi:hypothetical protein